MSSVLRRAPDWQNDYPTSDGKPMAETDWHRDLMGILIAILREFFAGQRVYVSGNLLVHYAPGNRRRHVSPDVFVVRGVENYQRPNYLVWEERKGPEVVFEITSSTTRHEDRNTKRLLYQDTLKVREYFLFDPYAEWLDPPLQGYRLLQGVYEPIRPRQGRLYSQVLGLYLERDEEMLRLWNSRTKAWLPTPDERLADVIRAREEAEELVREESQARIEVETENERLRRELDELRRRLSDAE
jgi:Uma2 family endonuclease